MLAFVSSASAALKGNWTLDDNADNPTVAAKVGNDGTLYQAGVGPLNTDQVHTTDRKEGTGAFDLPTLGVGAGGTAGEFFEVDNSDNALTPSGAYTVMFWIKVTDWTTRSSSAYVGMLDGGNNSTFWDPPEDAPYWYINTWTHDPEAQTGGLWMVGTIGTKWVRGSSSMALNTWYHVAFTHNPTTERLKVYENAAETGNRAVGPGAMAADMTGGKLYWGIHKSVNRHMPALYDDVAIFTQELSQSEIEQAMYMGAYSIPEPSTIALLGLGGLALIRRKR